MTSNTSNSQRLINIDSRNLYTETRREFVSTSNYQSSQQPGIDGDGGLEYNLVYRSMQYPQNLGFDQLVHGKQILLQLVKEFKEQEGNVVFEPYKKQEYAKRLMLLQKEIDGVMRQSFLYTGKNSDGSVRTLDYNALINQKQNQIVHLERKIAHLEAQLRMKDLREKELEDQLQRRFLTIRSKNDEIQKLRNASRSYADLQKNQNQIANDFGRALIRKVQEVLQRGGSMSQLQNQIQGWVMGLPQQSQLKRKLRSADEQWLEDKYKRYVSYLTTEAGSMLNSITKMYTSQMDTLKSRGTQVDYSNQILQLINKEIIPRHLLPTDDVMTSNQVSSHRVSSSSGSLTTIVNTFVSQSQNNASKVVEVPVQDVRTKALIHKLTTQLKRLSTKYPKLLTEISPQLSEYFSQEIIDVIEVDQLDRLVEIVKYVPEVVRTQNVYAYSSQKSRKVEFHLRVLIKALLEEMQRMKIKTGVQPQIDQGVIGMIRQEIMDVVDVDDILKVYRVVPKIVEVQKIKQTTVQKIVPVPHFVSVSTRETDVVPVNKVEVVQNTVNVPLSMPKIQTLIHEKLLLAPQYHQKVVVSTALEQNKFQTQIDVPTVRNVQKVVGLMQDNAKIVEIQGPQKIVPLEKQIVKTLIEQKIVPVEKIIQEIIEVPKIVEKIVTVIQQVPKIIEVEKIVEKIVTVKQYVESQRVENFVVEKPVQVICYVEKIVPVEKIVQRAVSVPEIVEKIVTLIQKQEVIKTVQVIKQVPIYKTEIKVVQRIVEVPGQDRVVEVAKPVDRIIQVPFIHDRVRVETEYRKQPVIQREEKIIREPVHVQVPVIMKEEVIVQVDRPVVHIVKEEYPRDLVKEKIVPVETVRQQLVPAPYIVEKIIQKIVEVPKIVEVEKIVEKIVPIPRVVEKIVQVEKIVEKIVERTIYQTDIKPVQYITEVPIEVERVQTIEVPKYVIERKQIPQIVEKDRIIINETKTESVRVQQIEQPPRVTIERREVPIEIVVQKLVPLKVQENVYVQLKQQIVVPVQVPIPTPIVQQKIVPVQHIIPVLQQVDRVREKIVQIQVEMPGKVQTRDRIVEKLFVEKDVKVVKDQIPYYQDRVVEVEKFVEKIVPVQKIIKQVMQVPYMVEKIVNQIVEVPRVQEIERIVQVPVRSQQLVTVDRIIPKIVTLNKAFAQIVDKLHEFPRLAQQMKKVNNQIETIVPEKHTSTNVQQSEVYIEKAVVQEKLKQVQKYVNVVNQSLKVAERVIEKPMEPIIITQQKILEVPVIVQKLAQRIVVMPQIVQVLKYIHQITDKESLGVALHGEVAVEQAQYQRLGQNLNMELSSLRALLADINRGGSEYRSKVTVIDNFLKQFNKFLTYPRIREIMTEKVVQNVVEKDRIVKVPVKSSDDERRGLASAVLIDKLLMEVRKLRQTNQNSQYKLDQDLVQIFGQQLQPVSSKYGNNHNQLLDQYSKTISSKFNMYGTWTSDHQRMLKDFIEQRFQLANRLKKTSKDSIKYRQLYNGAIQKYNREKINNQQIKNKFGELQKSVRDLLVVIIDMGMKNALEQKLNNLTQAIFGYASGADTITYKLTEMSEMDKERANRYLREKDALISELRITIENLKKQLERRSVTESQGHLVYGNCNIHTQIIGDLQAELNELRKYREMYGSSKNIQTSVTRTIVEKTSSQGDTSRLTAEISRLNSEINRLNSENSRLISQNNRLKSDLSRSQQQITRLQQQLSRLQRQIIIIREIQIQHRGCSHRIDQLEQKLRITIAENQRYQKELYQMRSVKESKPTVGSINSPNRAQIMSDSYGTNYMQYIRDNSQDNNSSGIRGSRAQHYEKNVFRSGGNYNTATNPNSTNVVSSGYIQQRSSNYLADSRASGASGSLHSNGNSSHLSSKSSKGGAIGYTYQQSYKQQYTSKVDGESNSGSRLYGTSSKEIIQRSSIRRDQQQGSYQGSQASQGSQNSQNSQRGQ